MAAKGEVLAYFYSTPMQRSLLGCPASAPFAPADAEVGGSHSALLLDCSTECVRCVQGLLGGLHMSHSPWIVTAL